MRKTETYILRLLMDPEEPHALRGVIRAVADGREQAFADGPALLALLRRMSGCADRAGGERERGST